MPKRCSDTHFYVSGHKTRSGHARYTTPDGTELAVVCGRNRPGPGQIHLRDVPDRVTLHVEGHDGALDLQLEMHATRGHRGRRASMGTVKSLEHADALVMLGNLMHELPLSSADDRELRSLALTWISRTGLMGSDADTAKLLDTVLTTNVHAYLPRIPWRRTARGDRDLALRHMHRLTAELAAADPTADPKSYAVMLRELAVLHSAMNVGPADRLVACAARAAAVLPTAQVRATANALNPDDTVELAARLLAERGSPHAGRARQLGALVTEDLMARITSDDALTRPAGGEWLALRMLSDPAFAAVHPAVCDALAGMRREGVGLRPQELGVAARFACPSGRRALEQRFGADAVSAAAARPGPAALIRPHPSYALRAPVKIAPPHAGLLGILAPTAPTAPADPAESAGARAWRYSGLLDRRHFTRRPLDPSPPREGWSPESPCSAKLPTLDEIAQFRAAKVTDLSTVRRLARAGVKAYEIPVWRHEGATTYAAMIDCASHGMTPRHIPDFRGLHITDRARRDEMLELGLSPQRLFECRQVGLSDDDAVFLRRAHIDAFEAVAYDGAQIPLAEMPAHKAAGVEGRVALRLARDGVSDPADQRTLAAAGVDEGVLYRLYLHYAKPQEVLQALDRCPLDRILGYTEVGMIGADVWAELHAAEVPAEQVGVFYDAGIHDARTMAMFFRSGIRDEAAIREHLRATSSRSVTERTASAIW